MPENVRPSPPLGARWTHRKAPFGRRSISQTASGRPLGSHQCATCSALVQASKTTARGASKMRVITISRSVGVVIFTVPMFFIGDLSLSLRASTVLLLLLRLFQVSIQAGKFLLPEAAKGLHPVSDILERNCHERARTPLRVAPAPNEARALKHIEVLGDCRLAQGERLHEFRHVRVSRRETSEDRPSCGIGQRSEGQVQTIGMFIYPHIAILPNGDIQVKP